MVEVGAAARDHSISSIALFPGKTGFEMKRRGGQYPTAEMAILLPGRRSGLSASSRNGPREREFSTTRVGDHVSHSQMYLRTYRKHFLI